MEEPTKELYESPAVKVLELKSEGIICVSIPGGLGEGGWI